MEGAIPEVSKWLGYDFVDFDDPVFEGIARDFLQLDNVLTDVSKCIPNFISGVEQLCEGLQSVSQSLVTNLTKNSELAISSDCCKFRQACTSIAREDAPHSALAKLKRDINFNVVNPIKEHLEHYGNLKNDLAERRKRLSELHAAKAHFDSVKQSPTIFFSDKRYIKAQSAFESAKSAFLEADRVLFEWLMMLEEYKCDIYDSLLQTMKYLQYEFFAASAISISSVLPARMEFRPMMEMVPSMLGPQVEMELEDSELHHTAKQGADGARRPNVATKVIRPQDYEDNCDSDEKLERRRMLCGVDEGSDERGLGEFCWATAKIVEKLEREGERRQSIEEPQIAVDPMSLSVLISQNFDEARARRGLILHNNDTQAALDWLLGNTATGHTATGHTATGHTATGHTATGHTATGHTATGHTATGHTATGHTATGHTGTGAESGAVYGDDGKEAQSGGIAAENNVRLPTTLKWVHKLRDRRVKEKERRLLVSSKTSESKSLLLNRKQLNEKERQSRQLPSTKVRSHKRHRKEVTTTKGKEAVITPPDEQGVLYSGGSNRRGSKAKRSRNGWKGKVGNVGLAAGDGDGRDLLGSPLFVNDNDTAADKHDIVSYDGKFCVWPSSTKSGEIGVDARVSGINERIPVAQTESE